MNCHCIKETEAAIRQQLETPEAARFRPKKAERLAQVEIQGAGFAMKGMDLDYTFTLPVKLTWAMPDGLPKKTQTTTMNKNEKLAARLELAAKIAREGLPYQAWDVEGDLKDTCEWVDQPTRSILYYTDADWGRYEIRIKPAPTKVPLEPADIPPGSALRQVGKTEWHLPTLVNESGITCPLLLVATFRSLMLSYEIMRPGQDWQPCYKEIP